MAELIHTTRAEIKGPFLIDRSQIEALNKILEEEWSRFAEERKRDLDRAVEKDLRGQRANPIFDDETDVQLRESIRRRLEKTHAFRERKEYFVFLKDGPTAKVQDFASALREPDLQDKEPSGLYAILESCDRSCEVTLTGRRISLEVEVSPKRDNFVQQTLMVLKNWQNSVQPPKWQSIWVQANGVQWFIWIFAVLISLVFVQQRAESAASRQLGQEAIQLLTNNISTDKQGRAIQLLLAKAYGYQPGQFKREYPSWFVFLITAGLAYCIALTFAPNVAIAIGRGERQVQRWRQYSTFILITTPTFVFVTFMWPRIDQFLRSIF